MEELMPAAPWKSGPSGPRKRVLYERGFSRRGTHAENTSCHPDWSRSRVPHVSLVLRDVGISCRITTLRTNREGHDFSRAARASNKNPASAAVRECPAKIKRGG